MGGDNGDPKAAAALAALAFRAELGPAELRPLRSSLNGGDDSKATLALGPDGGGCAVSTGEAGPGGDPIATFWSPAVGAGAVAAAIATGLLAHGGTTAPRGDNWSFKEKIRA